MEIRARINLEVAKFRANTKIVSAQFRAMGTGAKKFSDNVDHYAKRSLDRTKVTNIQRVQDTTKTGQAILAREKKLADDRYSVIMQAARKAQKDKSKIELEAVRNTGGIRPGTNVGRPLLDTAFQRKENMRYHEWLRKANQRTIQEQTAAAYAALRRTNARRITAETQTAKRITMVQMAENVKAFAYRKAYDVRYLAGKIAREIDAAKKIKAAERAEQERYNKWLESRSKNQRSAMGGGAGAAGVGLPAGLDQAMAAVRYALYDVGRRAIAFGTALNAAIIQGISAAAKFESAFTAVERTTGLTGAKAAELKTTLIEMSKVIPVSFEEITKVATLGAQLGIAADAVDNFTETVVKFSAITGISAEQAGLSFGRLAQLIGVPVSEFENLSSAIAFTGVNSVATDAEILKMTESIGAAASMAGFSSDEVVGFGAALASLKVRPEEARGVFTRLFREFDKEAGAAGARMDDFAKVIGASTEEAIKMYKQDPGQFFQRFLEGANAAGTLNETMAALGIVNTRELNVITRLASNMDVLTSSLDDAREQYLLGTYSSDAYALVQDDLTSKVTMMQNAIQALAASFGDELLPGVKLIVDAIKGLAELLTSLPGPVKVFLTIITAITAAAALFFGSIALGIAGLLALKLAFKTLGDDTVRAGIGIGTFNALLRSMVPNSTAAGAALTMLGLKAKQTGTAFSFLGMSARGATLAMLGIVGIAITVVAVVMEMSNANKETEDSFIKLGNSAIEANGGMSAAMQAVEADAKSGKAAIDTYTVSLTEEQVAAMTTKQEMLALAEAHREATQSEADRTGTLDDVKEAFNKTGDAAGYAADEAERYNGVNDTGLDEIDPEIVIQQGEEYMKWLAKGARNYIDSEGNTKDFLVDLVELEAPQKAALAALGFDYMQIYEDAVVDAAGDGRGGQAYVDSFQKQLKDISIGLIDIAVLSEAGTSMSDILAKAVSDGLISSDMASGLQVAFDTSGLTVDKFITQIDDLPPAFNDVAKSADATNKAFESNITADAMERASFAARGLSEEMGDTEGQAGDLNEVLKQTVDGLTAATIAEQQAGGALNSFAESAKQTNGELTGLGAAARENLGNFASFMQAAAEASIAAGEGSGGAFKRILGGLVALEEAGINTSGAFLLVRDKLVEYVSGTINADAALKAQLATAPNLDGMRDIINAFYASKIAAQGWSIGLQVEWQKAIATLSSTAGFTIDKIKISGGAVKTALQKLQELLSKTFLSLNVELDVKSSLSDLGKSLQENGKSFSKFSEGGRENIESLLDVIDQIAIKSNGNTQVFVNDLASLRKALVQAGAGADALSKIDQAIKATGKNGKASAATVKAFAKELKNVGEQERALLRVDKAIKEIANGIKEGLSARFAQGNAIDALSSAWLNVSDAADAAQGSIDDANKSIRDARLEIDETNASIAELTGNRGTLEYQLGIALKYGDVIRANEIRAEIAGIDADIAQKQADIIDANQQITDANGQISKAQGTLGNTPDLRQEIERRNTLQSIAILYADVAAGMLANAKPGEDLNAIIAAQVKEFEDNAKQLGFTEDEIKNVSTALREELTVAIKEVPKEIRTTANVITDPALKNVKSFVGKANAALSQIRDKTVTVTTIYQSGGGSAVGVIRRANGGLVTGPGTATSDSIAARLSNGEYVVKASAVKHYGVDFFNALNQMQTPPASMRPVNVSGGGSQTVYLSPEDRQLLRQAIDRPVALYTDNTTIAQSANAGNQILAQRGIR